MKPSVFEGFRVRPELTEQERLRRSTRLILLVALLFSVGLYIIGVTLAPTDEIVPAATATTMITLIGFVLALLGFTTLARIIPPTAVLLAVFYLMWSGLGLHDIAISGFGITLIFAGLMLGPRGPLYFSMISSLGVVVLGYGEMRGILNYGLSTGVLEISAISITTIGAGVFLYVLLNQFEQSLSRSRENEQSTIRTNRELLELKANLESRIDDRTANLQRRSRELEAAAQVARETVTAQDPQGILSSAVQLIAERFGHYFVGIFLNDPNREFAVLTAASSDNGKRLIERGYQVRLSMQEIVGSVAVSRRSRIIPDTHREPGYPRNIDLPLTRSEMALPLVGREGLIGILDIQSTEVNAFHNEDLEIMQTLADQLAGAIQNARLLAESRALVSQLETLSTREARKSWRQRLGRAGRRVTFSASGVSTRALEKAAPARTARLSPRQRTDIPVTVRGQRIGRISLFREENAPAWSEEDKSTAAEITRQVGLALENARLTEEARQRAAREQMISAVSSRVRETLDLDTVLRTAAQEMIQALDLKEVEIRLGKPEKNAK